MVKTLKEGSFPQALNLLRKIVFDMQEVVLSTRMIPVSGVFDHDLHG
jgi:two-component system chemotaxis sensor kinase CheA